MVAATKVTRRFAATPEALYRAHTQAQASMKDTAVAATKTLFAWLAIFLTRAALAHCWQRCETTPPGWRGTHVRRS